MNRVEPFERHATTLKCLKTETHVVFIEIGQHITVAACPLINGCRRGLPEHICLYRWTETDKANRTYRRYCKKYGG